MRDVLLAFLIYAGTMYGAYRIGVWQERRDYVGGFIKQVEAAYWDGFKDGRQANGGTDTK